MAQDISGWIFKDQQSFHSFRIPLGTSIPANSYLVLCKDTTAFRAIYPLKMIRVVGNIDFSFSNSQDKLSLYDSSAFFIDQLAYNDELPMPKKCDGHGYTLELTNLNGTRTNSQLWRAATWLGTPGMANNSIALTPNRKSVVINEINYNAHSNSDSGDWFEIYNQSAQSIDISAWVIRDSNDDNIFVIPSNTIIPSKSYLVFCQNPIKFEAIYPQVSFINTNISFKSTGDVVRLYDQYEFLIDSVNYSVSAQWTMGANGTGKTLSLLSPELENSLGKNWAVDVIFGTPGRKNFETKNDIDNTLASNLLYPNPCQEFVTVSNELPVNIEIVDMLGNIVVKDIALHSNTISTATLKQGIYIVHITTSTQKYSEVLIKN